MRRPKVACPLTFWVSHPLLSPLCNAAAGMTVTRLPRYVGKNLPISGDYPPMFTEAIGYVSDLWNISCAPGDEAAHRRTGLRLAIKTRDDTGHMTANSLTAFTRRGVLGAFAATAVAAAPTFSSAFGILKGAGDIRKLKMHSGRTGESIDTVYWIDGDYIPEALKEISVFMRDWRNDQAIKIDTRAIDIWAAAHRLMESDEPYAMLSGYRSPETNAMLRNRSRSVARNSLHMKGQAADLRMSGRSVGQMARAAAACNAGGVGRYSRSNFVHVDCGPIRQWGR